MKNTKILYVDAVSGEPDPCLVGDPWTAATAQAKRREARAALRAIAARIEGASGVVAADAVALVRQLQLWLVQDRGGVLGAIHDSEERDGTYSHVIAVSILMMNLGQELGLGDDRVLDLGLAGLFHDIGKLTVPRDILDKPGKLDADELQRMREHAREGLDLLQASDIRSPVVLDVCLHHHERLDGTGYPDGLRGDELSYEARISCICDVYDALISARSYKQKWSREEALAVLDAPAKYDAALVAAFIRSLG